MFIILLSFPFVFVIIIFMIFKSFSSTVIVAAAGMFILGIRSQAVSYS